MPSESVFVRIPLSQGKYALVDRADAALVSGYRWYAVQKKKENSTRWYAVDPTRRGGQTNPLYMHRLIMGVEDQPSWVLIDHIRHSDEGVDNRRENLRVAGFPSNNASKRTGLGRPKTSKFL